ncbi:MAG: alpha/beta hydrolase [Phycisphaerae bacterium]
MQPLEVFGPQPAPKSYFTSTPDGWSLNLLRYQPSRPKPDADPVICCHGLGYNASFWDLTDQTSLPRFLQQRGYDVWCVSLRGSGQSTKPTVAQLRRLFRLNLTALQPEALLRRRPGLLKLNWTVDDHIRQDLPTILRFVTRTTGHRRLHWVGHSMGGMIIFAHLATTNDQRINTVVAVAVPMVMLRPLNRVFQTMLNNMQVVQIGNAVVSTSLPAIIGTLVGPRLQSPVDRLFYNADNVDYLVGHRLSYLAQEEISPGQFRQLMAMLRTGQFRSADGTVNYAEQLPSVRVPTLFVAGSLDQMATVGAVKWAYNRIGASDKRFVMFAKINGHLADYGHDDLIIGRHARSEVYPQILRWLEVHPRRSSAAQPTSAQQDRPRSNVNQPI